MKRPSLILGAAAVLALAAGGVWYAGHRAAPRQEDGSGAARVAPGQRAVPPFSLRDINGNRVDSTLFLGKPTVINFFATWCPPCREEVPGFVAVYDKYKDRKLELVGISLDTDTRGALPGFVASNRVPYRILLGNLETAQAFGWGTGIPATYFIGKDGRIRNVHVGFMDRESFEREVLKLL